MVLAGAGETDLLLSCQEFYEHTSLSSLSFLQNKVPPVSSTQQFLPPCNGQANFYCIPKKMHSKRVAFNRLAEPIKTGKKWNALQCTLGYLVTMT